MDAEKKTAARQQKVAQHGGILEAPGKSEKVILKFVV